MLREIDLAEVSDGKLYCRTDMAKLGCDDCRGCSACCRHMGDSIVLDPYDSYLLCKGLSVSFEQLLTFAAELRMVDQMILPNLKMAGEEEACPFLNEEGRCRIHAFRPGFCRMFPLGRVYQEDGFRYFLQVHECKKELRTKVKISKWLDIPNQKKYEAFVWQWHEFLKKAGKILASFSEQETQKKIAMYVLKTFYLSPYDGERDFYEQFEERMAEAERYFF